MSGYPGKMWEGELSRKGVQWLYFPDIGRLNNCKGMPCLSINRMNPSLYP